MLLTSALVSVLLSLYSETSHEVRSLALSGHIRHIGASSADRFIDCLTSVFGKKALVTGWVAIPEGLVCPASGGDLVSALKEKGVALVETDSYVVLLPLGKMPGGGQYDALVSTNFDIEVKVTANPDWIRGSLPPTPPQQAEIAKEIMRAARWPPIFPLDWLDGGRRRAKPGEPVKVRIFLDLNAYELRPGVESVLAVFGEQASIKRLIYGEWKNGKYHMMWDSPLIGGGNLGLGYQDVNGDGVKEILLSWQEPRWGTALAIFTITGEEITRQKCPEEEANPLGRGTGFACPIRGGAIKVEEPQEGKRAILVVPSNSEDFSHPDCYTLVAGHYSLPASVLTSIEPTTLTTASEATKLSILGSKFARGSLVKIIPAEPDSYFSPADRFTYFPKIISPNHLSVELSPEMLVRPMKWHVVIENSSSVSNSLILTVTSSPAPN